VCVCARGNVVKNSKNFAQANGARAKVKRVEIMTNKYGHILKMLYIRNVVLSH